MKEFGCVLDIRPDQRTEVFKQFRRLYDGEGYRKHFGAVGAVSHAARFSFLAGVTSDIDRHTSAAARLGDRWLKVRLFVTKAERAAIGERAQGAIGYEDAGASRREAAVAAFLAGQAGVVEEAQRLLDTMAPMLQAECRGLATLVAQLRAPVTRDRDGTVHVDPDMEVPTRLTQQLTRLAVGVALVRGRQAVGPDDVEIARRVAIDTIPAIRTRVITGLHEVSAGAVRGDPATWPTLATLGEAMRAVGGEGGPMGSDAIRRHLGDLRMLGVIEKVGDSGKARWLLSGEFEELATQTGLIR
jgi:hypothetical protein